MVYQMTVTLTDTEYKALSEEAAKSGKALETFLHEVLAQHIQPPTSKSESLTRQNIQE